MDREQLLNNVEMGTRAALQGFQSGIWTAIPAIVQSVNFEQMTITAQPTIKGFQINPDGSRTYLNYPLLGNVPIIFPSSGNFSITFPIDVGDEVLIIFSARCIDTWWQSGGIQNPLVDVMHDMSDGFAIPGIKSLPHIIFGISTTGMQIRNDAGTTYVEIAADGKIKLVSPTEIDVTGDLKVTGTITASVDVKAGIIPGAQVSLLTHVHTSATPGNPTSAPIPS